MTLEEIATRLDAFRDIHGNGYSEIHWAADALRAWIAANKESRFTAPEVGAIRKCLVCALDREWGIFSEATGETVCRICRDRARHMPTPYEETTEQGTFYKDNMPIGEYWRAEFDKYIALQSERERAAYQRGAAAAAPKESPQRKAFVEAISIVMSGDGVFEDTISVCGQDVRRAVDTFRAMIEAEKVEAERGEGTWNKMTQYEAILQLRDKADERDQRNLILTLAAIGSHAEEGQREAATETAALRKVRDEMVKYGVVRWVTELDAILKERE